MQSEEKKEKKEDVNVMEEEEQEWRREKSECVRWAEWTWSRGCLGDGERVSEKINNEGVEMVLMIGGVEWKSSTMRWVKGKERGRREDRGAGR